MGEAAVRRLAAGWGVLVARYYAWAVRRDRIQLVGEWPRGPVIWLAWHEANLLALVHLPHVIPGRRCHSLVPPGLRGWVAAAWVSALAMVPITLPSAGRTGAPPAMKALETALGAGDDVVLAADGSAHGPAKRVRRGAFWLAARSGCAIIPIGVAVRPAARLPRWDRLLIPLPGASVSFAFGEPIRVGPNARLDNALLGRLAAALETQTERARRGWRRTKPLSFDHPPPRNRSPLLAVKHSALWRLLANLLTIGVFVLGALVVIAPRPSPSAAGLLIVAALVDGADGWVARRAGGPTRHGALLDLAADWTAFGLGPAILVLARFGLVAPHAFGAASWRPGQVELCGDSALMPLLVVGAAGMFLCASLYRLTRHATKSTIGRSGFTGMPMPANGLLVVAMTALAPSAVLAAIGLASVSVLAVSRWRYPNPRWLWDHARHGVLITLGLMTLIAPLAPFVALLVGVDGLRRRAVPRLQSRMMLASTAPGPTPMALIGTLPDLWQDPAAWFGQQWRRYGDVVRIGLRPFAPLHLVVHPADVHQVLQASPSNFPKHVYFELFRTGLGDGLLSSSGEHWKRQRRLVQPLFNHGRLDDLGATITAAAGETLRRWHQAADAGEPIDLATEAAALGRRVISRLIFSQSQDALIENAGRAFFAAAPFTVVFGDLPLGPRRRFNDARAALDAFILPLIRSRREALASRPAACPNDLLTRLISARDPMTGAEMDDQQVRDECLTLVFTGHETLAAALTWALVEIGQHPAVEAKLAAELAQVLGGRTRARTTSCD